MSLPNPHVIRAIFETYLSIRANVWGLEKKHPHKELDNPTNESKKQICIDTLKKLKDKMTLQEHVDLALHFYDEALKEEEKKGYITNRSMLLSKILFSAYSYTMSALRSEKAFRDLCTQMNEDIASLDKEIKTVSEEKRSEKEKQRAELRDKLIKLGDFNVFIADQTAKQSSSVAVSSVSIPKRVPDTYHETCFITEILPTESSGLNETSFEDFVKNVVSGKRKLEWTELLAIDPNHVQNTLISTTKELKNVLEAVQTQQQVVSEKPALVLEEKPNSKEKSAPSYVSVAKTGMYQPSAANTAKKKTTVTPIYTASSSEGSDPEEDKQDSPMLFAHTIHNSPKNTVTSSTTHNRTRTGRPQFRPKYK